MTCRSPWTVPSSTSTSGVPHSIAATGWWRSQNELDVASKMQQSILPTTFPSSATYETFGTMHAALDVGGDFFDVVRLQDGRVGLAIADVSGKGVPAALFMMSSRTLLKGSAISYHDPGKVLAEVNTLLQEDETDSMFVTMLYAVYDPETGVFTYASGGHDAPLLVRPDGSSTLLPLTGGIALGVVPGIEYRQTTHHVDPGETIVLYTDGVTEAMNHDGELFGLEGLRSYFEATPPGDSEATGLQVMQAVSAFAGDAPQSDDITCLTLRRN